MVQYHSQHQTKIEEFGNLYQMKLNPSNRWIQLAVHFPWDRCVEIYTRHFPKAGRTSINPRIVIGSLIVKHKLGLSDEETVLLIEENPYIQYFLGLDEFAPSPLFSASLFVEWRKRLGNDTFNEFADVLVRICHGDKVKNEGQVQNKGKLQLDATVADQYITYPNDLGLLNTAREKTEAKKRQANPKTLRSAIRYHLNCLDRNIISINKMLDLLTSNPMSVKMLKDFWVIQTLNQQQREMYDTKQNRCGHRIVSISQPHVRPIVRGKAGKKVEFGTKIGLAYSNGFAKAATMSWEAYNESADLIPHAEAYKQFYGYYPELIQVDKIYGSNNNRSWCKERGIRMTVVAKGKSSEMSKYQKRKSKQEVNERNQIEGKFGQAKQGYGLNNIKAKLSDTSHSWIGAILFITNLVKFAQFNNFNF